MSNLSPEHIRGLLESYGVESLSDVVIEQMQVYLEVFGFWSKRVNLTTVREPDQVVKRHFGEGFALARVLPTTTDLLDLGSGAGFPGIPVALARPETKVTLAEVQARKAAFLGEATHRMKLDVDIWSHRAEDLIGKQQFGLVALRAVDDMREALDTGTRLLRPSGSLAFFVGPNQKPALPDANWAEVRHVELPGCPGGAVLARLG